MIDVKEIFARAVAIVGERGQAYGGVENSFERAAALASLKLNKAVTPNDVVQILICVKEARLATNPDHEDSLIDKINYAAFHAAFAIKEHDTNG